MNMLKLKVVSLLTGILITLLTGYVHTVQLIGGTQYGYPLTWLVQRVLAPIYNPWFINYFNFVIDVLIWSFLAWVVLEVVQRHMKHASPRSKQKKVPARRRRR